MRIVLRPEVEADLAEAVEWYESRGRGLGAEFLRAVDAALAMICRFPTGCPVAFGIPQIPSKPKPL